MTLGKHMYGFHAFMVGVSIVVLNLAHNTGFSQNLPGDNLATTVVITDAAGAVETINAFHPVYSDKFDYLNKWNYVGERFHFDFFPLVLSATPYHELLIRPCFVKKIQLSLSPDSPGKLVGDVELDDGRKFSGTIPDTEIKIKGKGELGSVELPIKEIRTIEYSKFTSFDPKRSGKFIEISREAYRDKFLKEERAKRTTVKGAKKGKKGKAQEDVKPNVDEDASEWEIMDGDKTYHGLELRLQDRMNTNVDGLIVYFNRKLRTESLLRRFTVRSSKVMTEVNFTAVREINFLGRTVEFEGKFFPEIHLLSKGGTPRNLPLMLKSFVGENQEITYGPAEEDDLLQWKTDFGYEGISINPVREIFAKRVEK